MTVQEAIKNVTAYVYMECENMPQQVIKALDVLKDSSREVEQYRALGTVEELKEAMEKQIPQKLILISDGDSEGIPVYDIWECPNCGEHYEVEYDDYDYCPNCGQAIDKSEMG